VEHVTFASLSLKSTEFAYFSELITRGERRAALGSVSFEIVLPTYSNKACSRFERSKNKRLGDEAFTDAIYDLFSILKGCDEAHQPLRINLELRPITLLISNIYSLMDPLYHCEDKIKSDRIEFGHRRRYDLFNHRFGHSVIKLCK